MTAACSPGRLLQAHVARHPLEEINAVVAVSSPGQVDGQRGSHAPGQPGQPKEDPIMIAPKTLARTAGLLYLLMAGAAFNELYVRPRIVISGDAAATADNIRASATLFRVGFVGDLVAATFFLLTAMALYLTDLFTHFLAPNLGKSITPVVIAPAGIAELSFMVWLLVKGVRVPAPDAPVPATAHHSSHSS